jgi:hypothetical protein
MHPDAVAAFRPTAVRMSVQLGKDVFAEESYPLDWIGQAYDLGAPPLSSSSVAASWATWVASRM